MAGKKYNDIRGEKNREQKVFWGLRSNGWRKINGILIKKERLLIRSLIIV